MRTANNSGKLLRLTTMHLSPSGGDDTGSQ